MILHQGDHEIRSERVRALNRWWTVNAHGDIPDRDEFHPVDFRHLLPYLLISDVEHHPFRVRYRLVGTRVVEATGLDFTGRYLDELTPAESEQAWMDNYTLAYRTRRPVMGISTVRTTRGLRFVYEFGMFPLRKGRDRIEQFVAIEDYFEFSHLFPELPEWSVRVSRRAMRGG